MTNDHSIIPKAFPRLSEQEVVAFLKTQRPDVSENAWRHCDLVFVLQWLLPAYAQKVHLETQEKN